MKIPPLFPPEELKFAPPAVTVFSDPSMNTIFAYLHEQGVEGTYHVKLGFTIDASGMVASMHEGGPIQRETFRPPDTADAVREEILRRIKKFARRYSVAPANIKYYKLEPSGEKKIAGELALPLPWTDPRILRYLQERYDQKEDEAKQVHARKLCEEGGRELGRGRIRAGLRHFRDARNLAPDFYLPFLETAEVLRREHKFEEAGSCLEKAKGLLKKSLHVQRKERQKAEKRIREIRTALESRPEAERAQAGKEGGHEPAGFRTPFRVQVEGAEKAGGFCEVSYVLEELPGDILKSYQLRAYEPLEFYSLRLEAERLKFLEGFDELMAPLHARIESYDHQLRTARIVLKRMQGRALLADEVGLGKTIEAGLILKEYLLRGMASKVLILCPPSLVGQWRSEMTEKFDIRFVTTEDLESRDDPRDFWDREPFVIASLALAKREPHQTGILRQEYDLVVVDEAHHLRNRRTLAWRFINQLKRKYILFLTATPIHNDLEELYNLATLLRPGQLGTPAQFRDEFMEHGSARKPKNADKLRSLLREMMVRNTRASTAAAVKLPRRIARTLFIESSPEEARLYSEISAFVRDLAAKEGKNRRLLLTLLQREAGSSLRAVRATLGKIEGGLDGKWPGCAAPLMEVIRSLKDFEGRSKFSALLNLLTHQSGKCLIFTEFLGTFDFLAEGLKEAGYEPLLFHGSLAPEEKAEVVEKFQANGRILLSTPAGGEGTNLQFCRTLINYDLPWNPMKIEQRIGRIHRIGQTGEVRIFNLAAKETVEHYLLKILDEKLNLFELVVGEAEVILGPLTEEKDFEEVLMDVWLEARDSQDLEERMESLGNRISEEKEKYWKVKELDEKLFGGDYETV